MSATQRTIVTLATLAVLGIYFFVTAPPPLPEQTQLPAGTRVPVKQLFQLVQQENATMRRIWTNAIVADAKARGMVFNEHWRHPNVEAGPLPALFLRETASRLEKSGLQLGLFLGSDAPISAANRFDADQQQRFARVRAQRAPQFFYQADIQRHIAMFPDVAVTAACVDCHNQHEKSPKHDWRLNDVMGAATWLYPHDSLTLQAALAAVAALRLAMRETYHAFIAKTRSFHQPPAIGGIWPKDDYALPSVEVFMTHFAKESSEQTLATLLETTARAKP